MVEVLPREGCLIEAEVSFVQGIFGIGGEAHGPDQARLQNHQEELAADLITSDMKGCVIVGGARVTEDAIEKAQEGRRRGHRHRRPR